MIWFLGLGFIFACIAKIYSTKALEADEHFEDVAKRAAFLFWMLSINCMFIFTIGFAHLLIQALEKYVGQ